MVARHQDDQRLVVHHLVAQIEGRLDTQEGHVEPAADQRFGEVRRIVARDRDLDALQLIAQHMHGARQPVHLVTGLEADGERLSCRLCGPARRFHRGIELTAAGRAFLDHARLALTQAETAAEAARRAAQPAKPIFAMGFLTGQEVDWLPRATSILRDELLNIEIKVSSDHSTMLADDLQRGKLDIAFLRVEQQKPDLAYKLVAKEPIVVILQSDHPLAEHKAIDPHDLVGEKFIGISNVPRVLRGVVGDYLRRSGIEIVPHLEIDNFAMAVSLVASTRGVALLPVSAENFLKWSVISRPLEGEAPTIDLVVGYHKANTSPILRTFLSRIDDLTGRISSKARRMSGDRPLRRDGGSAAQGSGELLLSHRIVSRQRGRAHVRGAGHSG